MPRLPCEFLLKRRVIGKFGGAGLPGLPGVIGLAEFLVFVAEAPGKVLANCGWSAMVSC